MKSVSVKGDLKRETSAVWVEEELPVLFEEGSVS